MKIECKECGNDSEFITQPNKYEIYEVVDGELEHQKTELINEEFKLYCRDCSTELKSVPKKLGKNN